MKCIFSPKKQIQLLSFLSFFTLSTLAQAQFLQVTDVVSGPYNPQSLISNVFLGAGVEVTNIQFSGDPRAIGYFSGGTPSIGIERGIVMTTGFAQNASDNGAIQASDANSGGSVEASLAPIATNILEDVAVYTITFVPNSDTLRFRYSFASEEYPEYACSSFNDVFGFFIQGPGYPVFTNIALIPGTNLPVSINNIHPANPTFPPCPPFNVQYYNSNLNSAQQPVYDGFTSVFTATAVVTPCQPYTIKLAISDVGDPAFDSGVFLEAKSFGTGSLIANATTVSADGTIAEACLPGSVTFELPEIRAQDYTVNFNVFGTATPGTDYEAIPAIITIPAGQTSVTVPITAFEDGLVEPPESIGISVQVDPCNLDTVFLFIRDRILEPPVINDTSACLPNTPIQLDATVPTQVPPAPVFTNTADVSIPNGGAPANSTIAVFGVQPPVLGPGVIRSVCMNIDHAWVDDIDAYLISPSGVVLELTTDNGGSGDNYTNTCFTATASTVISFPGPFAPATAAPFTGDWLPEGPWTDLYGGTTNGNWRLRLTDDQNNINGTLRDWSITFEPSYNVSYSWSPGTGLDCTDCANPIATITQNQQYTVTATDSYGCTVTESVNLSIGSILANATILEPINCNGDKGTIEVSAPGNNTYQWSSGQTTPMISNLGPGTYTVTVTSLGAPCTATTSVTLTQPPALNLTNSPAEVACFGLSNGTAAVYPSGGTSPYNYIWSTGAQVDSIANLLPGIYSVTVSDANGCQKTTSMTVIEPSQVEILTALNRSPSCYGLSDGQLTTFAVGGTTPFVFVWNTGQVNQGINNIPAGTYTVTATDGNGCSQVKTEMVTQPDTLTSEAMGLAVPCNGQNTGAMNINPMGGTMPYTTTWTGPNGYNGTGNNLTNLFAGQYNALVTDSKGCTSTATATIQEPPALLVSLPAISDTICFSGVNGTARVIPNGGTEPYNYRWSANNQSTQTASGLASNEYFVTVTDANGCTATAVTFILQQEELNTYAEAQAPGCFNGTNGTGAVISIFYGATPANLTDFTYNWNTNPPQSGINVTGLQGGKTYILTASDALGCTATASVQVGNPLPLETSVTGTQDVGCNGEATGWASARAEGGTAPYTWQWNGGTTPGDSVALGLQAGNYRVTITDANGCPGTALVTIEEPTELRVQLFPTDVKCFGGNTGSIKAMPLGGTGPYTVVWETNATGNDLNGLTAGLYRLTVTDANGCTLNTQEGVGEPAQALTGTAAMIEPSCYGGYDGRIELTAVGGTKPYRYALDDKPFNGSTVQIGITAGTYLPQLLDANDCPFTLAPLVVTQPDPISVDLGPDIQIELGEDTQLQALVMGARGDVQYTWAPADSIWLSCMDCRNPSVYDLVFTRYFSLAVTDSAGCRADDQIRISIEKNRKVFVPTGFSPNGDFNNDLLLVHGQTGNKVLDFKVFDRWGELVFELKDFVVNDDAQGWDGTFRGQNCEVGVYVWMLEVEFNDGVREVFKGNTTLIR